MSGGDAALSPSRAVMDFYNDATASDPVMGDHNPLEKDSSLPVSIATGNDGWTAGASTMSVLPESRMFQSLANGM
jgi:hypothetical protein